jgi:preprotein translocase subunit YajC
LYTRPEPFYVFKEFVVISSAFAQSTAAAAATPESSLMGFLPLILMFVLLYFMAIRPQMKRQKEHKTMVEALQKGDEVIVVGGLLGRISKLHDAYISIEVSELGDKPVEVLVQRGAIQAVLPKGTLKEIR